MCCFLSRRRNTPMPMLVKNIVFIRSVKLEIVTRKRDRAAVRMTHEQRLRSREPGRGKLATPARRAEVGGADGPDAGAVDERAYA